MRSFILELSNDQKVVGIMRKDIGESQIGDSEFHFFLENPLILGSMYGSDGDVYVTVEDYLKDSRQSVVPFSKINVVSFYESAPELDDYYNACVAKFLANKDSQLGMYRPLVDKMKRELEKPTPEEKKLTNSKMN